MGLIVKISPERQATETLATRLEDSTNVDSSNLKLESASIILQILNNREISTICWVTVFIILSLTQKTIRESVLRVIMAFTEYKILIMFFMMLVYISIFISIFYSLSIWDFSLIKDTLLWTFGVAFAMLVNINEASEKEDYFKKVLFNSFKLIIVLEFITNFYVFNIVVELIALPIILLLTMISVFSERKELNKKAKQLAGSLIIVYGIVVLMFSIYHVSNDFENFTTLNNIKLLLLSPILTTLFLPFIYITAVLMTYESFLIRVKWILKENKKLFKVVRMKVFLNCRFNLKKIHLVSKKLHIYTTEEEAQILNDLNLILKK